MLQFVQVTAEYSNAVLIAILPYVNDFVKTMDLPIAIPVQASQVVFRCSSVRGENSGIGGGVELPGGYGCSFGHGIIEFFYSPKSFRGLQDPRRIPEFYGEVKMTQEEAIALCLKTLGRLGHATETFEKLAPTIALGPIVEGHSVARYFISWEEKWRGRQETAVEFEIDTNERKIVRLSLFSTNFFRPQPIVSVKPVEQPIVPRTVMVTRKFVPLNPAFSNAFFKAIVPEFSQFSHKLALPIIYPLRRNAIKEYGSELVGSVPGGRIVTTNGYEMAFFRGYVVGFRAPGCFFDYEWQARGGKYEDFVGPITMTVDQVAEECRKEIRKLGYPEEKLHLDGRPNYLGGPINGESNELTHYWLEWSSPENTATNVAWNIRVEFDSQSRTLKSLEINNPELKRDFPKLDVKP